MFNSLNTTSTFSRNFEADEFQDKFGDMFLGYYTYSVLSQREYQLRTVFKSIKAQFSQPHPFSLKIKKTHHKNVLHIMY